MLDIDRWLMLFSFTVKLVGEIMRASWGFRVTPRMHPIDAIASGGKLRGGKSCLLNVTAKVEGMCQHGNPYSHG